MKKRDYLQGAVIFLVAAFLVVQPATAQSSVDSVNLFGYEIEFLGAVDNSDGTQTWSYRVTETEDAEQDLSHWTLELCVDENDIVEWSPGASDPGIEDNDGVEVGSDGSGTDITGIKWNLEDDYDDDGQEGGDSRVFSFTVQGGYPYGQTSVDVGVKTGRAGSETGSIVGPDCEAKCVGANFNEVFNNAEKRVELTIEDPEGIQWASFTDEDNNPFLNNFDVELISATNSEGSVAFENDAGDDIFWEATGDWPTKVVMHLHQKDPENPDASYFLRTKNGCGTIVYIDPPHTFSKQAASSTLEGSYPNPFRTQTTVQFHLEAPVSTTLTVYDVMGRRVATLVEEPLQAGPHEVVWNGRASDGSTLASGVYFVRLKAGDRVQTRRITLVK